MKKCFKCKISKPLELFYRHSAMADGHLSKCKSCTKKDVSKNYRNNIVYFKAYEIERNKRPERRAQKHRYDLERKIRFPGKYRSNRAVSNAILRGKLDRKPCEICADPSAQAHHPDYRKPLFIQWLCLKHHREIERK